MIKLLEIADSKDKVSKGKQRVFYYTYRARDLNSFNWLFFSCIVTGFIFAAIPLTCLKDNPRKGEKLTLSPSGTLAAITDSLGRILLMDTQALVVVRLWKVCLAHLQINSTKTSSWYL